MIVEHVPLAYVHIVWPSVEGFIVQALASSPMPEYTIDQVRAMVATGKWNLLVISEDKEVRGAAIIHVYNTFNNRVAFVKAAGGRGVMTRSVVEQVSNLARAWGATQMECGAQPGMQRLMRRFGLHSRYTVLGVTL